MRHNLAQVRRHAPANPVWAVVKANAYGHGLEAALRGFADAEGLALVEFESALRLRELGWTRPILLLEGPFEAADVVLAQTWNLSLAVHEPRQIDWLAGAPGAAIDVYLKVNSGMNRLGFPLDRCVAAADRLRQLPAVRSLTWMTHFANADTPIGIETPLTRFLGVLPDDATPRSMANSAAIIDHPAARVGWLRPGVMLYGASPFSGRLAQGLSLRAAMHLESRLIAVQNLQAGDTVGYGGGFAAPHPMRVGVVACGYADGYPRVAPTGTPIAVAGVTTRTLGRVSMDMLCVDLTPVPQAQVGDPVQLWGDQVPIDTVAESAGTIGYELMCALAPRVPVRIED